MKAIISVANVAAGVGKTNISISLAAELALRGFRTLLIDADPQAHATSYMLPAGSSPASLTDVLCGAVREASARPVYLWEALAPNAIAGFDFVPADIGLAIFESMEYPSLFSLREGVEMLASFYEFVVIDAPPSLGSIAQNCLHAATHVVAPVAPRTQAREGLRLISKYIAAMPRVCAPDLLGIACNFFDCCQRASGEFVEELRREFGELVCETFVHRDELIERCGERHQIIQSYAPASTAATLFAELADELLARMNITVPQAVAVR